MAASQPSDTDASTGTGTGTGTGTNANTNGEPTTAIKVSSLSYSFPSGTLGLDSISLSLPPGSRTLLIGSNGAGKTTLLRLLSGKRMSPSNTINIHGVDPFTHSLEGVTYLGTEWVLNPIVRTDIAVPDLLNSVGAQHFPSRAAELVRVLDIDTAWRMHQVSDGERRRVQLAMGLIRPWHVLLLDEITVDLDLLSRFNFLAWLKAETESRAATVVYATHILDNLAGWPSHLVHMAGGRVKEWGAMSEYEEVGSATATATGNSRLGHLVLKWLREDLAERGPRGGTAGRQTEGIEAAAAGIGGYGLEKTPVSRQ